MKCNDDKNPQVVELKGTEWMESARHTHMDLNAMARIGQRIFG